MPKKNNESDKTVWSCNEWDPLEEVIVGNVEGAIVPLWSDISVRSIAPNHAAWFYKKYGGKPFPAKMIKKASKELEGLVKVLKNNGVKVRRPDPFNFSKQIRTPWWKSRGLFSAMPRDIGMVVGDTIIEAPMAWRTRYFESMAYHKLFNEYFDDGAKWLPAPKPTMSESFYNKKYSFNKSKNVGDATFPITDTEIAFDAADFVRLGKDLIVQESTVTNKKGIEWVRRHLGPEFNVHVVKFVDKDPMHIDTTIVPLAPGKLMINPNWVRKIPDFFKSWDILVPPPPINTGDKTLYFSSDWLTINVLSLDEKRVVVEEQEEPLIKALEGWGFEPIPIPFRNFYPFGGSVHCATMDIRRKGGLKKHLKY